MAKKIKTVIKLQIPAGKANPAPPVGPALGQHGLNIMEFCTKFNAQTKDRNGEITPVVITVYEDRTYTFITKLPPVSELIKQTLGIKSGAGKVGKETVGTLTQAQLKEIAAKKLPDLNAGSVEAAIPIVAGTARSMGVKIE